MAKQALDGTRLNAFGMDPNDLVIVGFDTDDGPEHPLWDERVKTLRATTSNEFVASIMRYSVLETVLVRKSGDRVEVVDGRHRVLGCRLANELIGDPDKVHQVPCMVKKSDDATVAGIAVVTNEARVDDSPVVRARKMQRMLDRNLGEKETAIAFCVDVAEVRRTLLVLDLDDRVQALIEARSLSLTAALTLKDMPRDEQWSKAQEYAAAGVTGEEAKRQTRIRKVATDGNGDDDMRGKPLPKPFLRKLADDEEFFVGLGEYGDKARDFVLAILGDANRAKRIAGLTSRMKEAGLA